MEAEKFDDCDFRWISRLEMDIEFVGCSMDEWVEVEAERLVDGIVKFSELGLINVNGERCIRLDGDPERKVVVTEMHSYPATEGYDAMEADQTAESFTVRAGDLVERLRKMMRQFVRSMYLVDSSGKRRITVGNAVGGTGLVIVYSMVRDNSEFPCTYTILVNEDMAR